MAQLIVDIIENPQDRNLSDLKKEITNTCLDKGVIVRVIVEDE